MEPQQGIVKAAVEYSLRAVKLYLDSLEGNYFLPQGVKRPVAEVLSARLCIPA